METLVGAIPVLDAVVDPAVERPEHRIHMGGKRVAEEVVLRAEPARGEIGRKTVGHDRGAVGGVPRHRGPAHVQPVMHAQFQLRTELAEGQLRQVRRVLVLRFPDQEIGMVGLGAFQAMQPLAVLVVIHCHPGRRHGKPVRIVEVTDEAGTIVLQRHHRSRQTLPGRQVLHGTRGVQHVPVHEKKSIPEALRSLRGPRASRSRSSGPGCQPTPRNALRCFSESRCHLSREACHSWWNSRCCGDTSQPRSFSLSTMRSWARGK